MMYEDDDDISEKPTIASLQQMIGDDLLAKLSADLGGRRLYIPHNPGENSPIAVVIGLAAARKISDVYAGMQFDVPVMAGRRYRILQMRREGVSVYRIAHALGVSRAYVNSVCNDQISRTQLDFFKKS